MMRMRTYANGGYGFKGIDPTGGTMNLPLRLVLSPSSPMDAVTKSYVDSQVTSFSGSTILGTFNSARLPAWSGSEVSSVGGGVFTLSPTGVVAGTYTKVTVDAKGRVTGGGSLSSSDIPGLSWSKVIGRPTTLAGYGITDVVSLNGGVMTGALVLSQTPTSSSHLANKAYVDGLISVSGSSPFVTGDIIYKSMSVTPMGYLRCNGGEVSKTTYSGLYAVVGDTYNVASTQPGAGQPWRQQYDINTTQSEDITGWTTATTSIPDTLAHSQAVVTKNRVYMIGGYSGSSGTFLATVYTAPINTDGTLGTWTTATALPGIIGYSHAIVTKNRVYLLGGYAPPLGGSLTVYTAPINTDGTLGTWTIAPSLPATVIHSQVIVTKNRVYLLGGVINGNYSSTVYTAPINTDGTLGTWTTGTSLPGVLSDSQSIVTKNRVYLLGGHNGSVAVATVYTAVINTDGTLDVWATGTSLPEGVTNTQFIVTKNRVYLLGGGTQGGVYISTARIATINTDGTLGTWTTGTPLPSTVAYGQTVVTKNRVYMIGGLNFNGSPTNIIYAAPISGGLNDYSPYYDGTITFTDSANFNLPDLTSKDKPGSYSYIRY